MTDMFQNPHTAPSGPERADNDTLFTDDDVRAGARALIGPGATDESIKHWSVEARAIIEAVATSIAARALRQAAASESGWCECDTCFASQAWLRARADAIEGGVL